MQAILRLKLRLKHVQYQNDYFEWAFRTRLPLLVARLMRFSFRAFLGLALPAVLVMLSPLAFSGGDVSAATSLAEAATVPAADSPAPETATTSTTTSTAGPTTSVAAVPVSTAVATTTAEPAPATTTPATTSTPATTAAPESTTAPVAAETTTTSTTTTPAPRTSAPLEIVPAWFAPVHRPDGACRTPSGAQRLGYTETFFGQGFCASTGHGAATDLYVLTHEVFHAATSITDETVVDCLVELHLRTELPSAAYGCPNAEVHRGLYDTIMAGNYPRPEQAVCIGELAPHHTYDVWTCTGELAN